MSELSSPQQEQFFCGIGGLLAGSNGALSRPRKNALTETTFSACRPLVHHERLPLSATSYPDDGLHLPEISRIMASIRLRLTPKS
jgi:hypothetical protein